MWDKVITQCTQTTTWLQAFLVPYRNGSDDEKPVAKVSKDVGEELKRQRQGPAMSVPPCGDLCELLLRTGGKRVQPRRLLALCPLLAATGLNTQGR